MRLNGIYGDGPAWLGAAYSPFDSGGAARRNMDLRISAEQLGDRGLDGRYVARAAGAEQIALAVPVSGLIEPEHGHTRGGERPGEADQHPVGELTLLGEGMAEDDPELRGAVGRGMGDREQTAIVVREEERFFHCGPSVQASPWMALTIVAIARTCFSTSAEKSRAAWMRSASLAAPVSR